MDYLNPQINNIIKQDISIQVSLNGFSFSAYDSVNKECLAFRHYHFNNIILDDELIRKTEEIIFNDSLLQKEYEKILITYLSQKITLVPEEFFKPEYLKKYFEFNHNLAELDELHFNYIAEIKAFAVFSMPNYLTNLFYSKLPNSKFKHQCETLINCGIKSDTENNADTTIILGINYGFFDMVIINNKELVLYNSYQYTNSMDFLYFFLYTCRQLKIETNKLQVLYMGEAADKKELIKELKANIKNVKPYQNKSGIISNQLPSSYTLRFYNLFI